jgi:putative transposase
VLAAHGITCTMSRRRNAHDNAAMLSWFSTMTFEVGDRFDTRAEAKTKLFELHRGVLQPGAPALDAGYLSPA